MRNIKFRGKRIDNDHWIYGDLLQMNNNLYIYENNYGDLDDIDFGVGFVKVDPNTVGQFICRKDEKGREICVGDIIVETSVGRGCFWLFTVEGLKDGTFPLLLVGIGDQSKFELCDEPVKISWQKILPYRIVGNIYENPDKNTWESLIEANK